MDKKTKKEALKYARTLEIKLQKSTEDHKDAYKYQDWIQKELDFQAGNAKDQIRELYNKLDKPYRDILVEIGAAIQFLQGAKDLFGIAVSRARVDLEEANRISRQKEQVAKDLQGELSLLKAENAALQIQIRELQEKNELQAKEIRYYDKGK